LEDNIKNNVEEKGCESVVLIELAQDRVQWRAIVRKGFVKRGTFLDELSGC
jgi:hypothetical protein